MRNDGLEDRKPWYYRLNTTRQPDGKGKRKGNSTLEYNWVEIYKLIDKIFADFAKRGFKPTERELNYALISLEALPNLHKAYGSLVNHMGKARKEGRFPIDCLVDERHPIADIDDNFYTPDAWINFYLDYYLGNISDTYHKGGKYFPTWKGQKNYVENWTEKQAMSKHLEYAVNKENLQVRTVAFGGFPGTTELNEHVGRLKEKMDEGKNVYIHWYGDMDPSGESIDRSTIKKLNVVFPQWLLQRYAISKGVEFKVIRIAVTKQQIRDYQLPWNAERLTEQEQLKLQNDSRYANHVREHGEAYACEVDSLPILHPEEFNKIVVKATNQYFDENTYKLRLQAHKARYPEQLVNVILDHRVREFLEWINMKLKWLWLES